MNIDELKIEIARLRFNDILGENLTELFIQKLIITISRNIRNLFSRISTTQQKLANNQSNVHPLLLEEITNKLMR